MTEQPPRSASNLTSRTLAGLRWTYFSMVVGIGLQLIYQAIINRLLDPVAFGLMAIALMIMNFSRYFSNMGVGQAIIQKPQLDDEDVRAAFTSNILLGVLCFTAVWLLAPLLASLFREPGVVPLVRATGITLVLVAMTTTSKSILSRQLRFDQIAVREISAYVIGYLVVGIGLAIAGAGVWSLVSALIVQNAVAALLLYGKTRHPVRPLLTWARLRPLYGFGGRVSLISILEFFSLNLDTLAVGRYAGSALLGQYNRAFFLAGYPVGQLTQSLSSVLFPSFSRIQTETGRLKRAYLGTVAVSGFILLPVCAGMAVAAQEIVLVLIGPQWDAAAEVMPILCGAAAIHTMTHFPAVVCEARAELNKKLALMVCSLLLLGSFLWLARGHGLWAYATAWAGGEAVRHLLYMGLMRRVLDIRLPDVARNYGPALLTAAVVAGAVAAGRFGALTAGLPLVVVLGIEILLGGGGLLTMLRFGPAGRVREELRYRLTTAGILERNPAVARLAHVVIGP